MIEQEFAAGHVFFRPGDPGDRAYLLHDGQVELLAGAAEAFTRVGLFEPGDVFGEMALIEERPRALTARAVTASRATPMTRDEFEHQLTHNPASTRQYLRSLFERLRSLTARLGGEVEPVRAGPPALLAAVEEPGRPAPVELPPGLGTPAEWVVVVHPLTRKAAETLPDEGLLVTRFPLRIGRATAAHEPEALDLNDLWLLDDKPYNVSRNHCEIHVDREGPVVRDRGSHLGCVVNDEWIGGRATMGYARLDSGDNILVIGSRMSPYQFRVTVSPA
jgi:Cyclic nucleotide-binding domain/FHA domain